MSINIRQLSSHISQRIPPLTHRNLWLLLCFFVALQNCTVFYTSQSANTSILALVIWGGALICIEDQIDDLRVQPSFLSLFVGSSLLIYIFLRTSFILYWDGFIFALAPLGGFALSLLAFPFHSFLRLRDSLLCLLLLPAFALLTRILPEEPLSLLTAQGAGFFLSILGFDVTISDRNVMLPGGGVQVLAACNGLDMISQIFCIAIIFLLAFRIKSLTSRCLLLIAAPLIGLFSNCFRIALLAYFSSLGQGKGSPLFTFFHDDSGSLIFSGIAVFAFGALYMNLLERELSLSNSIPIDEDEQ